MRKMFAGITGVALLGLGFYAGTAAADTFTGVLIDQHCGDKMMSKDDPQKAAGDHKAACAVKCGKDGGYEIISGKQAMKLDAASATKATEYLAKADAKTKVKVEATKNSDGSLTVTSISAAE